MGNTIVVRLKPEAGDYVRVVEGTAFEREFHRADEPFTVSQTEWPILERTGLFEKASE